MYPQLNPSQIVSLQGNLRRTLMDKRDGVSWNKSRDLAARMLLYIGDESLCLQTAAEWLSSEFSIDRVDFGYLSPDCSYSTAAQYVASADVPQLNATSYCLLPEHADLLRRPFDHLLFQDFTNDARIDSTMRVQFKPLATATKLVFGFVHSLPMPGLLCLDNVNGLRRWDLVEIKRLSSAIKEVVSPITLANGQLRCLEKHHPDSQSETESIFQNHEAGLTPTERQIARLVLSGLSYKEIAEKMFRSTSTIDHHLRSIRRKLGVSSTKRLAHVLTQ